MESDREARRFEVYGTVQGVGFRPFVQRLASGLGLDGWVRNVDGHVVIDTAGPAPSLHRFTVALRSQAPPLSVVRRIHSSADVPERPIAGTGFTVRSSAAADRRATPREIPPDAATCDACLAELFDPADRRYRYPFINCTDCGPRATVITGLPYDRPRTTMRSFPLCPACAAEYRDPSDRRFHAEPLACPVCGPRLSWNSGGRSATGPAALRSAEELIAQGGIVAVKGLGGYQLVCDARQPAAVLLLRRRKHRPHKPFAVMVADLAAAHRTARLTRTESRLLVSPARPVVLVADGPGGRASAEAVHPGTGRIGLFLPATGLHHLLLRDLDRPLVVTSGNLSDEPIATADADARTRLAEVADGFLAHDRPIAARYDDSVTQAVRGRVLTIRRARGYAPAPLPLPVPTRTPVVAAGAQSKHTVTVACGDRAVTGPHTGDLSDARTMEAFERCYADLVALTGVAPLVVAHDLHPGYLSTQWAAAHFAPEQRVAVQHHHAHIAACAAEHRLRGPFLGIAYDGLGFGDDGTLWGGEVLVADYTGYRRIGRFATAPLPGGEAAVRRPARMALGYLYGLEPLGVPPPSLELARHFTERLDAREVATIRTMVGRGLNCPRASSAGRLFDAAAALLGLADSISYEGQAAVALENAAGPARRAALPWRLVRADGLWVYDPAPTLTALLGRLGDGTPVPLLAAAFHTTIAEVTAALAERAVAGGAPRTVCLGGGCFVNRRLLTEVSRLLRVQGMRVVVGSAVPVGDGGISYGQAAVAAARLRRG
ncbi:(NiFe) hydrogenase maturation protein HypF [Streptomyces sp. NRRL F-5755]|uniref:carbamoyltransferase HypF n=1 Tax=Streptomyces sp. NRRL F-5755 TaxID=1519475 RepID=UPI0006AE8EB1|nr:carbamoyltransferase HypF [Streptomyces sp. NRRL F-5755]KOT89943.1 (NiFe) hydrogenase maturation protein HypF [Streptomyces sp. NRRL F-5755]